MLLAKVIHHKAFLLVIRENRLHHSVIDRCEIQLLKSKQIQPVRVDPKINRLHIGIAFCYQYDGRSLFSFQRLTKGSCRQQEVFIYRAIAVNQ